MWYSFRASEKSSCTHRLKISTHSRGHALVIPETQPVAPSATLSTIRSSTPQKMLNRSPSAIDTSVILRMSPDSLHAHNPPGISQPFQDLRCDVYTVGDRIVVNHDRQRR